MDGEDVSEWFVDGADVGIWNIFSMSITGLAGVDVAAATPTRGAVEDDEEAVGGTTDALDDIEALAVDMAREAILSGRRGCSEHGPKGLYAFGFESWGSSKRRGYQCRYVIY